MSKGRDVAIQSGTVVNDNMREEFLDVSQESGTAQQSGADADGIIGGVQGDAAGGSKNSEGAGGDNAQGSASGGNGAGQGDGGAATSGSETPAADSGYLAGLQKQLGVLNSTLQGLSVEGGPEEQAAVARLSEIDATMDGLTAKLESGEIGHDVMMKEMAGLMTEKAGINTRLEIGKQERQNAERSAQDSFLNAFPDFSDFARSEDAQQIIASNPYVMNNVSAYFAAKHAEAVQQNSVLQTQIAQLQEERKLAIKNAGPTQTKVVGGQKTPVQTNAQEAKPGNYNSRALAALARVRQANGQ